jgi:hypothetical protein
MPPVFKRLACLFRAEDATAFFSALIHGLERSHRSLVERYVQRFPVLALLVGIFSIRPVQSNIPM